MKRSFYFLLSILFGLSLSLSQGHAQEASGFTPIFNGENLDGWDGQPGSWAVKDGEIWCTGKAKKRNWLIWRKEEPADFILRMEFRWDSGNSGVQVRSDDLGDWQVHGYQVEVAGRKVMGLWHHSLLDKKHARRDERHLMALAGEHVSLAADGSKTVEQKADGETVKKNYKEHDWNTLEIIAKGDTLTQKINGVVFSTVTDLDKEMSRKKGFVALQDHGKGCVAAFRKIEIKQLKSPE